jgi:mannose/fructose/N-acetylgalactosamine-specific phosphotransferase system component IIC
MSPWLFLGWAVAVAVALIVVAIAIAVVIAVVRQVRDPKLGRLRKRVGAN